MENKRLAYIENLRIFLTVLVILQHSMRAYGRVVWWFVSDSRAPGLERFAAVNSSFFMGLFFFLSFYFMPASYDRKGFWGFHKDRLLRLFLPLLAYASVISASMMYGYFVLFRAYGPISFPRYFLEYYLGLGGKPADWSGPSWPDLNFGPLWFVEHLLAYGFLYSLGRLAIKLLQAANLRLPRLASKPFPANGAILALALCLGAACFAVRVSFPLYRWIGLFGFLQAEPAHLPVYLAMFVLGIASYRNDWLAKLPGRAGNLWLAVGIVAAAAIALQPLDARFFGGLSVYSLEYSTVEAFACVGLAIGLLYWFWKRFDGQNAFARSLSRLSYAAFILHLPIVAAAQYLLLRVDLDPYLKFLVVAALSLPATFGLSFLVKKLPWAEKYL